ncbi:MAG: alanine--tRNA ligase [Candidatus Paceibacterota bacterium]|nr:alanine--tRNA ligase [Candidatus Paceibacterota bacterium]
MQSHEIRRRFLTFFEKRGHTLIPSASLIPENDPSVLFNTAGMQPLVPYLLGETHPSGAARLVNAQKCVRTVDIDEIGDNTHATFFEMLGNWSLGDYFKEDAIKWSFEFLTDQNEGLGLDPNRLYVTVFEGDENAPRDNEAFEIWKKYIPEHRIYFMSAKSNWWSPGDNGPCGPDSEMFYDVTYEGLGDLTPEAYRKADDEQKVVEIWNDVFMEYEKKDGKVIGKLSKKNVDTGSGLERITMVSQGVNNIYDTDLLKPIVEKIKNYSKVADPKAMRIVADHMRTATFMIADGVLPSNTDRGYVLRRLLRRARYYYDSIGAIDEALGGLVSTVVSIYKGTDYGLERKLFHIDSVVNEEEKTFSAHLVFGKKLLEKMIKEEGSISAENAFLLYSTYGFPFELITDIAKENNISVDTEGFLEKKKAHQEISRAGSEKKFKGGLADTSEISTRYHTATHLLHKALRTVLGVHVFQKGSNITAERMRFDFSHGEKMTDEQKKMTEDLVNEKINEALPVRYDDLPIEEAKKMGAMGLFGDKYGDVVRVYTIGEGDQKWSMELCGGPHVKNTSELGHFKIVKEEAVSAGVRRIKAILE